MSTLYLDSNVLIYLAQPHSEFFTPASRALDLAAQKQYRVITSSLGYAEFSVYKHGDGLGDDVDELFAGGSITEIPFGHTEARTFVQARQNIAKRVHPVDAMHIATALAAKAEFFVTNDRILHTLRIEGLRMLPLAHFAKKEFTL